MVADYGWCWGVFIYMSGGRRGEEGCPSSLLLYLSKSSVVCLVPSGYRLIGLLSVPLKVHDIILNWCNCQLAVQFTQAMMSTQSWCHISNDLYITYVLFKLHCTFIDVHSEGASRASDDVMTHYKFSMNNIANNKMNRSCAIMCCSIESSMHIGYVTYILLHIGCM